MCRIKEEPIKPAPPVTKMFTCSCPLSIQLILLSETFSNRRDQYRRSSSITSNQAWNWPAVLQSLGNPRFLTNLLLADEPICPDEVLDP